MLRLLVALAVCGTVAVADQINLRWDLDVSTENHDASHSIKVGTLMSTTFRLYVLDNSGEVKTDYVGNIQVVTTVTFPEPTEVVEGEGFVDEEVVSQTVSFGAFEQGVVTLQGRLVYPSNAQFSVLNKAATVSIAAEIGLVTAIGSLTIQHTDPKTAVLSSPNPSAETNEEVEVVVRVLDQYDNLCDSLFENNAGQLTVDSDSVTFTDQLSIANGVSTHQLRNKIAESVVVVLTYDGLELVGSPLTVSWAAGQTFQFAFVTVGDVETTDGGILLATADTEAELRLVARDVYGNRDTSEDRFIGITLTCNGVNDDCGSEQSITSAISTIGGHHHSVEFVDGFANFTLTSSTPQNVEVGVKFVEAFRNPSPGTFAVTSVRFTEACVKGVNFRSTASKLMCDELSPICEVGFKETIEPNATTDRECVACDGVTEFQDEPNQPICHPMGPQCLVGFAESVSPSPSTNRTCEECDGTTQYQDEPNQADCKNTTICVAGTEVGNEATSATDRDCDPCSKGFADADENPASPCTMCSPMVYGGAYGFDFDGMSGSIEILDTGEANDPAIKSILSLPAAYVAQSYWIAKDPCPGPIAPIVMEGIITLEEVTPGGDLAFSGSESFTSLLDVVGRGFYVDLVHNTEGSTKLCIDIRLARGPEDGNFANLTYTDARGKTECLPATTCKVGEGATQSWNRKRNRVCGPCNGKTEYQDEANRDACKPVTICEDTPGFREAVPPNATHDRVCEPVTCPGLDPIIYGFVSEPCTNSSVEEAFGTKCSYTCDATKFFKLEVDGDVGQTIERECVQSGKFSGLQPTCVCSGGLILDVLAAECVSDCTPGTFKSADGTQCLECKPSCAEGEFESIACTSDSDRECSACSGCEEGTFAASGCFSFNNTDTICEPHSPCDPGTFETAPGTTVDDRTCSQCSTCPNSAFAGTGCCGTIDTRCESLTECLAGEFESLPPQPAPQGGYGTDRSCQKFSTCSQNGQYYSFLGDAKNDVVCSQCMPCPYGSIATGDCVTGSPTQLGSDTQCVAWQGCGTGQFLVRKGTSSDEGECGPCRTCQSSEYSLGCDDGIEDTDCRLITVCDPVTEYEITPPTPTSDRVCGDCTVCGNGTQIETSCSATSPGTCVPTADWAGLSQDACPRGTAYIGTPPNHACIKCQTCPKGQFAEHGSDCDGPNTFNEPECTAWSECDATSAFEVAGPTATSDRVCKSCTPCPYGYMRTGGCDGVIDTTCEPEPSCEDILGVPGYEVTAGRQVSATDYDVHTCRACRQCNFYAGDRFTMYLRQGEYVASLCEGQTDTMCSHFSECSTLEFVQVRGTPEADRQCGACKTTAAGRLSFVDPYACPDDVNDVCSADATDTGDAADEANMYHYLQYSIVADADYNEIIFNDSPERAETFADALTVAVLEYFSSQSALAQYNYTVVGMMISRGSVVADFSVHSDSKDAVDDMLKIFGVDGLATSAWLDFSFEYEGDVVGVTEGAAQLVTTTTATSITGTTTTTLSATSITVIATDSPTLDTTEDESQEGSTKNDDDNEGLSAGAIGGIVAGAVVLTFGVISTLVYLNRKDAGMSNPARRKTADDIDAGGEDGYLGVGADAEDAGLFGNQVAGENRRLRSEVEAMRAKVAEKDALSGLQQASAKSAQNRMDAAIASRLAVENEQIKREIKTLFQEKNKKQTYKFQHQAHAQVQLLAEKKQLEEEIMRMSEIEQLAIRAIAQFDSEQGHLAGAPPDE